MPTRSHSLGQQAHGAEVDVDLGQVQDAGHGVRCGSRWAKVCSRPLSALSTHLLTPAMAGVLDRIAAPAARRFTS
jgi:hypothetical protein